MSVCVGERVNVCLSTCTGCVCMGGWPQQHSATPPPPPSGEEEEVLGEGGSADRRSDNPLSTTHTAPNVNPTQLTPSTPSAPQWEKKDMEREGILQMEIVCVCVCQNTHTQRLIMSGVEWGRVLGGGGFWVGEGPWRGRVLDGGGLWEGEGVGKGKPRRAPSIQGAWLRGSFP